MRQREGVDSHDDPRHTGDAQRDRSFICTEKSADNHSRHNPTDGAKHAHDREVLLLFGHMVERKGIDQPNRGHIADHVEQKQDDEPPSSAGLGSDWRQKHRHPSDQMQHPKNAFSGEESVGDHAEEERRNDCPDGADRIGPVNHIGHPDATHIIPHRHIPCPPHEELQKHHAAELKVDPSFHCVPRC